MMKVAPGFDEESRMLLLQVPRIRVPIKVTPKPTLNS